jgi:antitoxin (DNA-binding transcriptional repressor) of toxin-antitoxin stability system
MAIVSLDATETTLDQLLARVEAGEEIILARGENPVAKLTPMQLAKPRPRPQFGAWKDKVSVGPEFFEPLPEEELRLWEGGD